MQSSLFVNSPAFPKDEATLVWCVKSEDLDCITFKSMWGQHALKGGTYGGDPLPHAAPSPTAERASRARVHRESSIPSQCCCALSSLAFPSHWSIVAFSFKLDVEERPLQSNFIEPHPEVSGH